MSEGSRTLETDAFRSMSQKNS
jgi:hypothetical protein